MAALLAVHHTSWRVCKSHSENLWMKALMCACQDWIIINFFCYHFTSVSAVTNRNRLSRVFA